MRRRVYRQRLKFKLRKNTVYTIFAFLLLLIGSISLLSFSKNGENLIAVNALLEEQFGFFAVLFPVVLVLFGLLFLRLRIFLAMPHVSIGFLLFFTSLIGLAQSGKLGLYLYLVLADVVSGIGATLIFLAGLLVGVIVFFDTSIDEMLQFIMAIKENIGRFVPKGLFSFLKSDKQFNFKDKSITIKGLPSNATAVKQTSQTPATPKKDAPIIPDTLVKTSGTKIWEYPPLSLLSDLTERKAERGDVNKTAQTIETTLQSFGIGAKVVEVNLGPAVTQYALNIAVGTKLSKITGLANDLALATEAPTGQIRIEAPIPGRNLVGIEIPNRSLELVSLKTMLASDIMTKNKSRLLVSLGLDVSGSPVVADIGKMPHVLIAGTTGSGKSVMINSFICSLLFRASPDEVKLILIDPKRVELTGYNGIPHLMTPVIVEVDKILASLKWAIDEMDRRYKKFAENGVRNIDSFNELSGFQAYPYIVIFIDELADLMAYAPVQVEDAIARLAQMARATGIHLVVSTQRPSVDVITGLIKANIPCRIAFNVSSMVDSRGIIDQPGAEKLLGRGDMLYIPPEQAKPTRIQGAFVSEKEVKKLVDYLKSKVPEVEYTEEVTSQTMPLKKGNVSVDSSGRDPLFAEAVKVVCQYDRASASLLQRRLSIGYSRAARMLDQLEEGGVVGPGEGSKPRDVLVTNADEFIANLENKTE
jgi:DNA segregation ATPase FtsK/SpoIIIE, S-DNA-T family